MRTKGIGKRLLAAGLALMTAGTLGTVSDVGISSVKAAEGDDGSVRSDLTATELTGLMGNGINLGNTMEAYGHSTLGINADVSSYETCWGQPVTTQAMVDGMKAAGFDTLRIPIAWTNMMDYENGDYTISDAYLDRVQEIVDYARNDGMYVIINDHWDGGWWGMFGQDAKTQEKAYAMYESIWKQVSARFKDYSDYVIFESANEELGSRLNDKWPADTGSAGTLSDDACYEVMNKINQNFVNIVRNSGGNNAERFLLIAGHDTDIAETCDSRFVMPTDTASSKLLVSIHYYDPSDYTMGGVETWGSQAQYTSMNNALAKMKQFTDAGVGVIIGEYGVQVGTDLVIKKDTLAYTRNLLNNADYYGFCPILWDCNGEYSKSSCSMIDSDMAALYTAHSLSAQSSMTGEQIKAAAKAEMDKDYANADAGKKIDDNEAFAWLMFASSDWSVMYSVGDTYDSSSVSGGVVASTSEVTGEGEYTVGLDFTGTSKGYAEKLGFAAIGLANGEKLYSNYSILIEDVIVNGESVALNGTPYTASDDGVCTRVNLYNGYIAQTSWPEGYSPQVLNPDTLGQIKTISVKFKYVNSTKNRVTKKTDPSKEEVKEQTSWLMYANSDWSIGHYTGDSYASASAWGGVTGTTATVKGEGEYTVSLDFTGTATGSVSDLYFLVLGMEKGEDAHPDYKILVEQATVNGKSIKLKSTPAQSSDDGHTTRLQLFNPWNSADGYQNINASDFTNVKTFTLTFFYDDPSTAATARVIKDDSERTDLSGMKFKLSSKKYTYSGSANEPEVTSSEGLKAGTDYKVSYENNVNAGTATAVVEGIGDYKGTLSLSYTIKPKKIDNSFTGLKVDGMDSSNYLTQSYSLNGNKTAEPSVTITDTESGKTLTADDVTISYTSNNKVTKKANIHIKGKGNYTGSAKIQFVITK